MKKLKSLFLGAGVLAMSLFATACSNNSNSPVSEPTGPVTKEVTQADFTIQPNAGSWAYVTYSLSEFADKEVTIDFSCDIEADNKTGKSEHFMWQVNCDGYPVVAEFDVESGKSNIKVAGKNASPIKVGNGNVLYMSTNNSSYDIEFKLTNIKYTVTFQGKKETSQPAKKYPTDIFTVADTKIADFTADRVFDGNVENLTFNSDGTVTYIASAAGSGNGAVFYAKDKGSVINVSNYESIDIELVMSPVTGSWNPKAKAPGIGFRLYTPYATGFWSGFEDIGYYSLSSDYGTLKQHITIDEKWVENYKNCFDNDDIMGFAIKFNAYETGNDDSDKLMIQIKKVQFNKKESAKDKTDTVTPDGLNEKTRGTVKKVTYASHDYVSGDITEYQKPGWVYLPAGYDDPANAGKTYPLVILMHGFGQNQDTWGLTDAGNGGLIKHYMDVGMANGNVKPFILIAVTGVASKNYANGSGQDFAGFNAFGGELRNDLIPYMRKNYRITEGRDNVAMAGLSMGAMQTVNIGLGDTLDLISYFGAFSFTMPAVESEAADVFGNIGITNRLKKNGLENYNINYLYTICGTNDAQIPWKDYEAGVLAMDKDFDKLTLGKNFSYEKYEGGTHDFPVWYRGFKHLIPLLFK